MSDEQQATRGELSRVATAGVGTPADGGRLDVLASTPDIGDVVQILEERLTVAKRRTATGRVKVGTRTEVVEAVAEAELDQYSVEVTRVPVGRVVDEAPSARAEGDVTIVPVVEERLVVVKQLFLVEEVHIRHVLDRKVVSEPVTLRRQRVMVERLDASDEVAGDDASHDGGRR